MTEDFIQNIQFDIFSVELVIGETATLLMAEDYVTIREVFVDNVKVEPNENKQIFLESGGDELWELAEGDILQPKENRTFTLKKANEVDVVNGSTDKYLNEQGDFTTINTSPIGVTGSELYMSIQDSDIAGYKLLSNSIDALETEITITANSSQGIVWGNKYLTPEYTATTIPAKSWGFDYWRKVSTALNNSTKHLRVSIYRGGIETDIISLTSPDINDTDFVERQVAYTLGAIELRQGDRLGVQEGFSTTRVPDVTLTFIVGDGRGWFMRVPLALSHKDLENKNAETTFQHVDTTTTKETLVEADKVAIYDSETGKIVLTDKSNVGGGGSTDIISTNVTNNTGTIVINTTPNWQRVNISGGGNTLILDYPNGTLPTKNREYLLVINNATTITIMLTLPTVSFVKGGIAYSFKNTAGSIPIDKNRSIEVNVIFFFIDATTCIIRTQISQFI